MSWVKVTGDAHLTYDHGFSLPADYWGQVDVWIPPSTFTACNGDLFAFSATFLAFLLDGIFATDITPPTQAWRWWTNAASGGPAGSGPAPSTTYTIQFHTYPSGPNTAIDWYVNGTLIFSNIRGGSFPGHQIFLNSGPEGCCCEVYYYTNFMLGLSSGSGDIFADNFDGGLGNWAVFASSQPASVAVVAAPSAAACPTVVASPSRGLPGATVTVTGSGFAPNSPLTLYLGPTRIESFIGPTDGGGNVSAPLTVPHIGATPPPDDPWFLTLIDGEGNIACGSFSVCGPTPADGITTVPNPIVATGGQTNGSNEILDYIFHDGAHWVLWQDLSVLENAGTFPPPANHTMNATRISADGSSVVDYPIDTNYQWIFGGGDGNDEGLFSTRTCPGSGSGVSAPVWSQISFFAGWDKPIYDAHFASDGSTLWVAVLTRETVVYPWLDNQDACDPNPGAAAQFLPLSVWTAGFTSFPTDTSTGRHIWNTETVGAIDLYHANAFPVTDAGEEDTGYWSPPIVVMFAFGGGGFSRIGEIDAKYCPGITNGVHYGTEGSLIGAPHLFQKAQRGSLFSRVSICASPTDPGRCHVVWSEGGDWGRQGLAAADCTRLVWDSGPQNRSYRVNYTTWGASGKLSDNDIMASHVDRTNWFFPYDEGFGAPDPIGYTWPDQADFAGVLAHAVRNDNAAGTPYLFAVRPAILQNPFGFTPDGFGDPWLDNNVVFGDTLHVYDLTSGGAVEVQALDLLTLGMTNTELNALYTVGPPYANPVGPADCVYIPADNGTATSYGPIGKGFGLSLPYDDPVLGIPVYLVHIPLAKRFVPQAVGGTTLDGFPARGFYRVPCDMSAPFDYLDGDRLVGFTIVKPGSFTATSNDFFSDRKNIWIPEASDPTQGYSFSGYPGEWFDRVCNNIWEAFSAAWTPFIGGYWTGSQCPGFYYDPIGDSITTVVGEVGPGNPPPLTPLFAVATQFICRGCRGCKCGTGVHIAHRF